MERLHRALHVIKDEGLVAFSHKFSDWVRRKTASTGRHPALRPPSPEEYAHWIETYEPGPQELAQQTRQVAQLDMQPEISVIIPVSHPRADELEAALSSLVAQTYPHWQACLAVGGAQAPAVRQVLEKITAQDTRFQVNWLDANYGISGNSNEALEIARGEFVAFLDQDDTLAPFALWEVAQALNRSPACDLLYSDHDLLSAEDGLRCQPLFKPDWSPEIMLSANYITHLAVARTALVKEMTGFDPQLDGAQDWDLFLNLSQYAREIVHIPKILYHWRNSTGSTAENIWQKPAAPKAQTQAISIHLNRLGLPQAKAFFSTSGYIRVRWAHDQPTASIIIPTRGASRMLKKCINSIRQLTCYPDYEIIIVNNGPQRPEQIPYFRRLGSHQRIKIVHLSGGFNYSAANNFGAQQARGDLLVFLNNDTQMLSPDWLDELAMWAQHPQVGAVGAKLLRPDGTIQHAGVIIGLTGFAGHIFAGLPENTFGIFGRTEWYRDVLAVTGACLAVPRQIFEQVGGFDSNLTLCGNDVALCLQIRAAGLRVVYNPFVRLRHLESATRTGEIPAQDYFHSYPYYRPYLLKGDPYFNPNLSYWHLEPTLASSGETTPLIFAHQFLHSRGMFEESDHDENDPPDA